MKRTSLIVFSALAVSGIGACQKDDAATQQKLDQVIKHLASIDQTLKTAGPPGQTGRPPQQQRPPEPDPTAVYAVPFNDNDNAWKGAKNAKITVVEAFEFA